MKSNTLLFAAVTVGLASWLSYMIFYKGFRDDAVENSSQEMNGSNEEMGESVQSTEDQKEANPLRDFTVEQLREFNGKDGKAIYIALKGEVYDVSDAKSFYGEGGSYAAFAGRDCTRAMAKMSLDEADLINSDLSDLSASQRLSLDGWVDKFKYHRSYRIVGKLSVPTTDPNRVFTAEEIAAYKGSSGVVDPDRVDLPIYVGLNGYVFDVSYGGKEIYAPDGPYSMYAGKDISRSLGKMTLDPADIESRDISDFTELQLQTLQDGFEKFKNYRKYPIVGRLAPSAPPLAAANPAAMV
jgi:membrane-associated progesterone receptor component